MTIQEKLIELDACKEAQKWAMGKTWPEIFETCHRGDWLLWLFKRTNPKDLKVLTRVKAHCALTVCHLMKDQRSINACEVALKFADDQATCEELNAAAADAADAAADAADAADAAAYAAAAYAAAAYAAADAYADAAADAAAAYAAADAAYAAADAAADADAYADAAADAYADAAARTKNQKQTADICRKYLPIEIWSITE